MRAFSFVHAADLHLGYSQYGLEARREDFDSARETMRTAGGEETPI